MKNRQYKQIRKRAVKYRSVPKRDYRGLTESCFRLIFRSIFPRESTTMAAFTFPQLRCVFPGQVTSIEQHICMTLSFN